MKKLIFVGGTMGVGKTAVCEMLRQKLEPSVFLDGDWCWMLSPFRVTDHRKEMVTENIAFLLRQFLQDPDTENVIFCWVMHQQEIIDGLLERLSGLEFEFHGFSIVCSEEKLRERLEKDIAAGKRDPDIIERTLPRLPLYRQLNTILIDGDKSMEEEVQEILAHL